MQHAAPEADSDAMAWRVLRHLAEIGAGRCTITDEALSAAPTDLMRELLVALLTLHEDLQYERELRSSAEERTDRLVSDLRAAVAARDEFLSIASHELRTPLSTLRLQTTSFARLLTQLAVPEHEPALRKRLGVIERQVSRLEKLTSELVDVTRITSGRLELHRETVDLAVLTREVLERYRTEGSQASSIDFEADDSIVGEWDPFRIDQVASNLIANALSYGQGRPVRVAVRGDESTARLIVRDEGIGIATDQKDRIFEQFERAASSRNYGGLGLGLWIARQIVRAHGGGITVESELGGGATFVVTLPRAPSSPSAPTEESA